MAVKKSELYSSLWASCDSLRGGMDSSQYKDYILTLLFVKYVSDKYKGVVYADIKVPDSGSFDDMLALIGTKDIGEDMDKIIAKLADGDDIIGDAYEYLMRNFATESGKSKGQFYTPAEVSRILAKVVGIEHARNTETTLYDPACGSGSLLIRAAEAAPIDVTIYGQENKNRLRERDVYKITTVFNQRVELPKYSRFVPNDEIKNKNAYNLNIPRYIDSGSAEDLQSIDGHLNGGIPCVDVDSLSLYWRTFPNLQASLFTHFRDDGSPAGSFYSLAVEKDAIRDTINGNAEFSAYADKVENAFENWKAKVDGKLRSIDSSTKPKQLIVKIAEQILSEYVPVTLVDKYRTIISGIYALYTAVCHRIADRVTELSDRYGQTLPTLETNVAELESKVKSHLERMGFVW